MIGRVFALMMMKKIEYFDLLEGLMVIEGY